ncbi:hypothetical protein HLK59_49885 [Streptomyces sp. S3(2020)]|nr:hypothetical protein [Streptomyces sp. S3(2020)]
MSLGRPLEALASPVCRQHRNKLVHQAALVAREPGRNLRRIPPGTVCEGDRFFLDDSDPEAVSSDDVLRARARARARARVRGVDGGGRVGSG